MSQNIYLCVIITKQIMVSALLQQNYADDIQEQTSALFHLSSKIVFPFSLLSSFLDFVHFCKATMVTLGCNKRNKFVHVYLKWNF